MVVILNLILIGLALLIAYWWANQGFLSAVLHMVCVLVAGALAFAVWEPLALLMLSKGIMEDYAWGITLLGPFAAFLLLTRVAADKLVPDNLYFPQWANYVFGGAAGLVAGVLTMGMLLIGAGFVQSSDTFLDFAGATRTNSSRGKPDLQAASLWVPMHKLTADAYGLLSMGSLSPEFGRPLRTAYPKLAETAIGLHRDSAASGRARTAAPPDSVKVSNFVYDPNFKNSDGTVGAYSVTVDVDNGAADKGGMLTVSASQVRLIERLPSGSWREPEVAFPDRFSQPAENGGREGWIFDDVLNYATNVPGQQQTKFTFIFPSSKLGGPERAPEFMQFKGLRFKLPTLDQTVAIDSRGGTGSKGDTPIQDPGAKTIAQKDLTVDTSIAPATASINGLTNMEQTDQYLTEGSQEFPKGGPTVSPANRIKGIYAREGTAVVRLNISRQNSSIDLWNDRSKVREKAGENAALVLVDQLGNTYTPVGYIWVKPDGVEIRLDPRRGIESIADFPNQPSAGTHELYAIFNPTASVTIKSIRLGDIVVANANLDITAKKNG